jgi:hypothetical protein
MAKVKAKDVEVKEIDSSWITIENTHKGKRSILGREGVIAFGQTGTVRAFNVSDAMVKAGHIKIIKAEEKEPAK